VILSAPRLLPQERFDLEDLNALLSSARTDSKLYTKHFTSELNYILQGFQVSGIGLKQATVTVQDGTLIIPQNTTDFSWYVSSPTDANITIPGSSLTDGARNYVELQLLTQNNTPLTRAFWDPEASSGAGSEFNQIVDTITDLGISAVVVTGGFSGLPDRLPLCIMDVDGSGNIKSIFDRRNLFYRLGTPNNINNSYSWGLKQEPAYALNLSGVTGTFQAGETITLNTETATVVGGGTTSFGFIQPSGINFFPGSTVTGATSGATGTISTVVEAFVGVDKSIKNNKQMFDALATELKFLKGTQFWWQDSQNSTAGLARSINSLMVQAVVNSTFRWDGSNFAIVDSTIMSPAASDVLGYVRMFGRSGNLSLCRQDGTGGSVSIPVGEKQVVYISIPTSGGRVYSGVGPGATQFHVVAADSYVESDANYWICYRELGRLFIRGYGELETGESVIINDPMKENLEAEIAAINAILNLPTYDETIQVVASGAGTNQINVPVPSGTIITIPINTRLAGTPQQNYNVGSGQLQITLNGQFLIMNETNGWSEVGSGTSQQIQINQALETGDELHFRINATGGPGSGGGSGSNDFIGLPESTVADNADLMEIYDVTVGSYRKQTRANFLQGLNGVRPVNAYSSNHNLTNANGLVLVSGNSTMFLPAPSTMAGRTLDIKNVGTGTMVIDSSGYMIDNMLTIVSSTQYASFTIQCDGTQYWLT
jgi:hypothetical protein